jgi:hypothetical protein
VADLGRAELLLERDRELDSLREALADAIDGRGSLALVEGPAGIGKSRLLGKLRSAARARGALGAELRRARRPTDARGPLSRALEICEIAARRASRSTTARSCTRPARARGRQPSRALRP